MGESRNSSNLVFQAAVERLLSVVFRTPDGRWEGHDYTVELIAERHGLDDFDVVMDFRELEISLDRALEPLQGKLLSDLNLAGPVDLAQKLAMDLASAVPEPARLMEVVLTDGRGHRIALKI